MKPEDVIALVGGRDKFPIGAWELMRYKGVGKKTVQQMRALGLVGPDKESADWQALEAEIRRLRTRLYAIRRRIKNAKPRLTMLYETQREIKSCLTKAFTRRRQWSRPYGSKSP